MGLSGPSVSIKTLESVLLHCLSYWMFYDVISYLCYREWTGRKERKEIPY